MVWATSCSLHEAILKCSASKVDRLNVDHEISNACKLDCLGWTGQHRFGLAHT